MNDVVHHDNISTIMQVIINNEVLFRINPSQLTYFQYLQDKLEYLIMVDHLYSSICTITQKDFWNNERKQFESLLEVLDQTKPEANPTELSMVFEELPITSYLKRINLKCELYEYNIFKQLHTLDSSQYVSSLELASWEYGKRMGIHIFENMKFKSDQLPLNLNIIHDLIVKYIYGGPFQRTNVILIRSKTSELIFDQYNIAHTRVKTGDSQVHNLINHFEVNFIKGFLTIFNHHLKFDRTIIDFQFARDTFKI